MTLQRLDFAREFVLVSVFVRAGIFYFCAFTCACLIKNDISFTECRVGDTGATALASALKKNTTLQELILHCN
jgi:hypothetical protein